MTNVNTNTSATSQTQLCWDLYCTWAGCQVHNRPQPAAAEKVCPQGCSGAPTACGSGPQTCWFSV